MILSANIARITCINASNISRKTITCFSFCYRKPLHFSFSRAKLQITILKRNDDQGDRAQQPIGYANKKNFGWQRKILIHYKKQAVSNNKQANLPVQYGRLIAIKYFRGAALAREIVNILVGRFSQLKYFEKKDIQQQRSRKERIEHVFSTSQTDNCHCANQRKKSVRCSQKESPICSSTIRLIFSKQCSHGIPALFVTSVTFLKSVQKLFSSKILEFPCLSLQKHGAFLLGKESKSFMFLSSFEAIPHLTHRICAKP